jgi:phage/plasmid-associated DNA primase
MADDYAAAREGELVDEMPGNVRPLHRKEQPEQDGEQQRPQTKEERKRAELEEKGTLIQKRIRAQQEEQGKEEQAEGEQGRTTRIVRYELTDMGNANRLAHHFGHLLHHIEARRMWIYFDEEQNRWREDTTNRIYDFAEQTVETIKNEILVASPLEVDEIWKHYLKSQGSGKISAMIKLARHKLALEPEALISSNKRLVTASGLVDLETGQPCPPDTEDYGLRRTPVEYNPDATCPRWEQFIAEVMGKDQEDDGLLAAPGRVLRHGPLHGAGAAHLQRHGQQRQGRVPAHADARPGRVRLHAESRLPDRAALYLPSHRPGAAAQRPSGGGR